MDDRISLKGAQATVHLQSGEEAARLIWNDDRRAALIEDPRTPGFANEMIDTSAELLRSSPGVIRKMIAQAAAGAEDLAVAQFQGIVEVIQNADDVRATEVRLALRDVAAGKQLLIVHNGEPVTCHNVLGMALPYLTTKTDRVDQRGRFGIGMKTLRRVAASLEIHSSPYHFSGDQLSFQRVEPEESIPGFYDPTRDTLLVANLNDSFIEDELVRWFDAWPGDGLLFLTSVSSFRWCALDSTTLRERRLSFAPWEDSGGALQHADILALSHRRVDGFGGPWTVWRGTVKVPLGLHPAHKARSETTDISIAVSRRRAAPGVFIGFRTGVPISLPFSLDAQFDPNTSREGLIENPWNNWLVDRVADLIAEVAFGLLALNPASAWIIVPLKDECVGTTSSGWLFERFSLALETAREWLRGAAQVRLNDEIIALKDIAYEGETLTGLLDHTDIEQMAPDRHALSTTSRDSSGRWRRVLDTLNASLVLETSELLDALDDGLFDEKNSSWWVEAGALLVTHHPNENLFGRKFLLSDKDQSVACEAEGETQRPLVFAPRRSGFDKRWNLFTSLHPAYGKSTKGEEVVDWLTNYAAFAEKLDAAIELAAFAEQFSASAIEISDDELRDLRARFDELPDREADELGPSVGSALLLDGYVYKSGKTKKKKVILAESYLCKTLDGENSTWPDAAEKVEGLSWVAARYDTVLKTSAMRWGKRKGRDGIVSRGPRKFLSLLGGEVAPRIKRTAGRVSWGDEARIRELRAAGAEQVEFDLVSPDLSRVLQRLTSLRGRDARTCSAALMRTLSRNWDRLYAGQISVDAEHVARVYIYSRGSVTAAWLNELRNSPWVAVGRGRLTAPKFAVLRTPETQAVYETFVCDLSPEDVNSGLATALQMITDVRIDDLLNRLEELRDQGGAVESAQTLGIYRAIAMRCPKVVTYSTRIGEMTVQNLRRRFLEGGGLIHLMDREWRRPDELLRGLDIFHGRRMFAPGGEACGRLWVALDIPEPDLETCIQFSHVLAGETYGRDVEAVLIDVYRHMQHLIVDSKRRQPGKLKSLPLRCRGEWTTQRPVLFVENIELREQLASNADSINLWNPPCEFREIKELAALAGVEPLHPRLAVLEGSAEAVEFGEQMRLQFGNAVDHLSAELARSDTALRERISLGWDQLKAIPLNLYQSTISVRAVSPGLPPKGVQVRLRALATDGPRSFHFHQDYIGDREFGGQVIASLFPRSARRRIDAEWALAWQKSRDHAVAELRLASDSERSQSMREAAEAINVGAKKKIAVTAPKSRHPVAKPRTLKDSVGAVIGATIHEGKQKSGSPVDLSKSKKGLRKLPPDPSSQNGKGDLATPAAYTNADVEQRAWEILVQALETSPDQRLVDFRKRHGVGADGAFNWKRFVELKATARGRQSQIELSNSEYERAKQCGNEYILALVSGLESGYKDEVRLIFDPANCTTVKPTNGVKLTNLGDAPAVIVNFEDATDETENLRT